MCRNAGFFLLALVLLVGVHAEGGADDSKDLVLTLTESNFADALAKHPFLVVEFYAPWCGHCKQLEPEYQKAAAVLAQETAEGKYVFQPITLAKVDATVEKGLGKKYDIRGFPTIKIFESGAEQPYEYEGPRDSAGIVAYLKSQAGPASTEIKEARAAKELAEDAQVIAVYSGKEADKWTELAKTLRGKVAFVHTSSKEVLSALGVSDGIHMVKKFDERIVKFDGKLSETEKLLNWINFHRHEVGMAVSKGDQAALKAVFEDDSKPNLFLFLAVKSSPSGAKSVAEFKKAAMSVRGKMISGFFEFPDFPEAFDHFGLKSAGEKGELPVVLLEDRKANLRFQMEGRTVTKETVDAFLADYRAGKLQPFLKSEEPPAENDGPVRVIVGKTFEAEVSKAGHWVLLEAYAPWCGHCKKLVPIYEEVGRAFAGQKGVTIAKVDATANELPRSLNISGFPTLLLFKGDGSQPEVYQGERSWAKITAFVTTWSGVPLTAGYEPPAEILAANLDDAMPLHMRIIRAMAEEYQVPFLEEGRTVPGLYVFALIVFLLFVAAVSMVIACLSRESAPAAAKESAKKKD